MKTKLILGFIIIFLIFSTILAFYIFQGKAPITVDGYTLRSYPGGNPQFCGYDEISSPEGQRLFTVLLCEDSLKSILKNGDWVYASTTAGRTLRANIKTGEREILSNHGGVGGMQFKQ